MQLLGRQTSIEIVNILFSICLYTNLLKLEKDFYDEDDDEVEASSIFLMQVMRVYEMIMIVPPVSCTYTEEHFLIINIT